MTNSSNKEKREISQPIADFIAELKKQLAKESQKAAEEKEEKEEDIEEAGENVARLYEKVRNLIEYKDDHLIKRNAIERILKRNLLIELRRVDFADQFLDELMMSGYIERNKIDAETKLTVRNLLKKYKKAIRTVRRYETKRWLVGIASCEIEETLFPNPARFALVRAMYQTVKERIIVKNGKAIKGSEKDIQTFLATIRAVSKPDNASLNYSLLKIYLPHWFEKSVADEEAENMAARMPKLAQDFRKRLSDPMSLKIGVALRKYAVFFNIFYEAALSNISKIDKILTNPESLEFTSQMAADEVYGREMKKFRKRVKRSLIFLIITKIALAVVVEYPFDLYIIGSVVMMPIIINLIFPPLYLIILSITVHRPSEHNSVLIAKGVEEITYGGNEKPIAEIKMKDIETFSDWTLNLFFLLTYGVSFGLAIWVLNMLHFNWLGILIFLFLFSVVSFFNALVRQPVRELLIAREKEGMVGMLIDTLSMPFVKMGKWMSVNFSRVNVIIFVFDVIIEAPFKVVVRFIKEWAGFIRRKRDEMI